MARNNYYNKGDAYSEWHRALKNDLGYIDIDSVGICLKNVSSHCTWRRLHLMLDKPGKLRLTTEALARLANLPSFLIFYKVENNTVVSLELSSSRQKKT